MSHITVDLLKLHKTYFGGKYEINSEFYNKFHDESRNAFNTEIGISMTKPIPGYENKFIFFPLTLWANDALYLEIECATIRVSSKKTIIKTPVSRRIGTVKEQYAVGDYVFTINGVLFNRNRAFPEREINKLKMIYEIPGRKEIHSAFAEIFLNDLEGEDRCPIVIESLEFPEKKGGDMWHIPFTIVCETDFAETLIFSEDYLKNSRSYVYPYEQY